MISTIPGDFLMAILRPALSVGYWQMCLWDKDRP